MHVYTISTGNLSTRKLIQESTKTSGSQKFPILVFLGKTNEAKKLYSIFNNGSNLTIREIDSSTGDGTGT